jgi:dTDP-4-amino-4,6-dideoxygalactose transaminase
MYNEWPLGHVPEHLQRPELAQLEAAGYTFDDPRDIVELFERKVADFAGASYAVAVDCCSHGLFLCLKYLKATGTITVPSHTYVSVPMQIMQAGCSVELTDEDWTGKYQLKPYPVWDSAIQWHQGMYQQGLQVVSFQFKKYIPIGRGGMILTDDVTAYQWLRKARYDGRDVNVPYIQDDFEFAGWHMYMTPEDAARGILLMDAKPGNTPERTGRSSYVDLSTKTVFKHNAQY